MNFFEKLLGSKPRPTSPAGEVDLLVAKRRELEARHIAVEAEIESTEDSASEKAVEAVVAGAEVTTDADLVIATARRELKAVEAALVALDEELSAARDRAVTAEIEAERLATIEAAKAALKAIPAASRKVEKLLAEVAKMSDELRAIEPRLVWSLIGACHNAAEGKGLAFEPDADALESLKSVAAGGDYVVTPTVEERAFLDRADYLRDVAERDRQWLAEQNALHAVPESYWDAEEREWIEPDDLPAREPTIVTGRWHSAA